MSSSRDEEVQPGDLLTGLQTQTKCVTPVAILVLVEPTWCFFSCKTAHILEHLYWMGILWMWTCTFSSAELKKKEAKLLTILENHIMARKLKIKSFIIQRKELLYKKKQCFVISKQHSHSAVGTNNLLPVWMEDLQLQWYYWKSRDYKKEGRIQALPQHS